MTIEVFAKLKDFFDKKFEVDGHLETVSDLKKHLIDLNPASSGVLQVCRFAVDDEFVQNNYQLKANDYVSVIPPSSGG